MASPTSKVISFQLNDQCNILTFNQASTYESTLSKESSKLLGEGSFGKVYKITVGKEFHALKKIQIRDDDDLFVAVREVNILYGLQDLPGVPRIYKCEYNGKYLYIEQTLLFKSMEDKKVIQIMSHFSISEILAKVRSFVYTILSMHNLGIVHGDIKPQNICALDEKISDIVVIDFGLSKTPEEDFQAGTPGYFSPDLLLTDKSAQFRDDIWAIGRTIIEIIFGQETFNEYEACIINAIDNIAPRLQKGAIRSCLRTFKTILGTIYKTEMAKKIENDCNPKSLGNIKAILGGIFTSTEGDFISMYSIVVRLDAAIQGCNEKQNKIASLKATKIGDNQNLYWKEVAAVDSEDSKKKVTGELKIDDKVDGEDSFKLSMQNKLKRNENGNDAMFINISNKLKLSTIPAIHSPRDKQTPRFIYKFDEGVMIEAPENVPINAFKKKEKTYANVNAKQLLLI
jgi:serine/threonine protein kinase